MTFLSLLPPSPQHLLPALLLTSTLRVVLAPPLSMCIIISGVENSVCVCSKTQEMF